MSKCEEAFDEAVAQKKVTLIFEQIEILLSQVRDALKVRYHDVPEVNILTPHLKQKVEIEQEEEVKERDRKGNRFRFIS